MIVTFAHKQAQRDQRMRNNVTDLDEQAPGTPLYTPSLSYPWKVLIQHQVDK